MKSSGSKVLLNENSNDGEIGMKKLHYQFRTPVFNSHVTQM